MNNENKAYMGNCYNMRIKNYYNGNYGFSLYSDIRKCGKVDLPLSLEKNDLENKRKTRCSKEEFSKRNLSASRVKLFDYVNTNKDMFLTFITLTFRDEIFDLKIANKKFHSWQVTIKQAFPEFVYVGVPEFQKTGRAHYHLLTNIPFESSLIYKEMDEEGKQRKTFNKERHKCYLIWSVKYWKHGFSTVANLSTYDNNFNPAKYLAKYLYKDIDDRLYGHQKIMVSKSGLKKPLITYSLENIKSAEELEMEMMKKGYDMHESKVIENESDNPYVSKKINIMSFHASTVNSDEDVDLRNDYMEDLQIYISSL